MFSFTDKQKPGDYQNIVIPWCYKMIIDYPLPRIRMLRIEGTLEFQQVSDKSLLSKDKLLSLLGKKSYYVRW